MKKIIFCGYRSWSYALLEHLMFYCKSRGDAIITDLIYFETAPSFIEEHPNLNIHTLDPGDSTIYEEVIESSNADMIIFAGWSWIVPNNVVDKICCICLHPSDLPKFAGGSPIQNQVLSGIYDSKLSVFKMDDGIDTGPIYKKTSISLLGPIEEVFDKIVLAGLPLLRDLISDLANNELTFTPQTNLNKTTMAIKRRTPMDSLFSLHQIKDMTFEDLKKTVDVLRDPYPNLKIVINENLNVVVKNVIKLKKRPMNILTIDNVSLSANDSNDQILLSIKDGFAIINEYIVDATTKV